MTRSTRIARQRSRHRDRTKARRGRASATASVWRRTSTKTITTNLIQAANNFQGTAVRDIRQAHCWASSLTDARGSIMLTIDVHGHLYHERYLQELGQIL